MNQLIKYNAACKAIAAAKQVDEVKGIHDRAAAMQAYAKVAKNRDLEIDAAEIRMRAERRLGELLALAKVKGQISRGQPSKKRTQSEQYSRVTLDKAGIDRKLSSKSQRLAAMPQPRFEGLLKGWRHRIAKEGERVTANLLKEDTYRQARKYNSSRDDHGKNLVDLKALADSGEKYGVIYADPPWDYYNFRSSGGAAARQHYNTMTLEEIAVLPVHRLAAKDCALFMWAVMPELPGALATIKAWGFTYKTVAFTWVKQTPKGNGIHKGLGHWTKANAELCLLATRGSPSRLTKDISQVIMAPLREHSRKPEEAAERIERLLRGPYLELFARQTRHGWTSWGNEV